MVPGADHRARVALRWSLAAQIVAFCLPRPWSDQSHLSVGVAPKEPSSR
jgi:hypothetical protein